MRLSEPFIRRPVATTLLTLGVALAGVLAYLALPVAPLPQVDFPTISVMAQMPGASPEVMAATVAAPLERHLGQIADVSEMTSSSSTGATRIILQFGLARDIDGAARDVQAAINAARADLPSTLRSNPTYRKVNPADAPIMVLALTSTTRSAGQLYDAAASILAQKLSQISGVGQVTVGGSSLPAVRVELNPRALDKYGIGLEDVRAALAGANANTPKGSVDIGGSRYQLYTNDQARHASEYRDLVIAYRNGGAVRLREVADVVDSVENVRNLGLYNGRRAVLLMLFRQPDANIIETVDRVVASMPALKASLPGDIEMTVANDRTVTIRASLHDVERTLVFAIGLVVLVVFLFLRNGRATFVPAVAVPISLLGTFAAMYLLGYTLDNLSLMALIVATGFVVDDAIVVLENVTRHLEAGLSPFDAAVAGAREVGFTVLSMSLSLVAVFTPILLMGGIVGRLFREFSMTLAVAVLISLVVSLTTTPMLCALLVRHRDPSTRGWLFRASERVFEEGRRGYARTLQWSLRHRGLIAASLAAAVILNIYLSIVIPKGFFPQQDTGRLVGGIQADQSISFQALAKKLPQLVHRVQQDPAVDGVMGFIGGGSAGGGQSNGGTMFVNLRPRSQRDVSADQVIARLRSELSEVPGVRLYLQSVQDVRVGGRQSNAQYQYTLRANDSAELYEWAQKLAQALSHAPALADVNTDQQQNGLQIDLDFDRNTASRLQLDPAVIDSTLYDAFGQRTVSTIYNPLNQYHVVMEVAPQYSQGPHALDALWVSTAGTVPEQKVPLPAVARYSASNTPLAVNHQGMLVASTISFNLAPRASLSDATAAIQLATLEIGMPSDIHGSFQGTARAFEESLSNEPVLILAALAAVYIVLGVLYESYIHPLTILSTLPSAGTGAVLALLLFKTEFSIIALIGVILLIGIVKKNAIMMIDFALTSQRERGIDSSAAIYEAALLRFRPIMMTTLAAVLGVLPLAFGTGDGAEIRRPLGIAIVGGLILSQALTLYTTPVMYIYLDRLGAWLRGLKRVSR